MEQIKLVQSRRGNFIEKDVWLKGLRGGDQGTIFLIELADLFYS